MKKNQFTKPKLPPRGVPQVKPQIGETVGGESVFAEIALFYMSERPVAAREISTILSREFGQKTELWEEFQIIEWITEFGHSIDIEQMPKHAFSVEDQTFLDSHHVESVYSITALDSDLPLIQKCFAKVAAKGGGFLCYDTEDFMPILPV